MARNKLAFAARKAQAKKRDIGKVVRPEAELFGGTDITPSRQLAARELLEQVQQRLSPEERELVECRQQGLEWQASAERLQGSPEALRKKLARALDRIAREVGLDEADHD